MSSCMKSGDTGTPYEKAIAALHDDPSWAREIALGRRVGLYRLQGDLGSGNFSKVKIAVHHLIKETVAIKTVNKLMLDAKTNRMLNREISIMQELCHPNIVKLFEVIETLDKVHLVLECAGGGELCAAINSSGRMTEARSRMVFEQVLSAVDYLHSRNVIHRDIKSENVFLLLDVKTTDSMLIIKVGDFGFSTTVSNMDERLKTFCGSPPYAAPELFEDESYVGPAVDIWALGVLLFFIVTGHMPFRAHTVRDLKRLILQGDYRLPSHVSVDCAQLIGAILRQNPRERYTLERIMESSWMTTHVSVAARKPLASMYHPWPTLPPQARNKFELEARRQMQLLGIREQMIAEQAVSKCCNHSIIGTFRIFMHVLHDAPDRFTDAPTSPLNSSESKDKLSSTHLNKSNSTKVKKIKKTGQIKKSNTCAII